MLKLKKFLLGMLIFILIAGIAGWLFLKEFEKQVYNEAVGESNVKTAFEIKKNQSGKSIGKELEKKGLIKSKYHFYYYLWKEKTASKIQAGEYELSPNMTIPEITSLFFGGKIKEEYKKITIPEGFDNKKIIERLGESAPRLKDDFSKIVNCKCIGESDCKCDRLSREYSFLEEIPGGVDMEGYLFPDTYFIYPDETALDIIKKFLDNFQKKRNSQEIYNLISSSERSFYEILTMASIIEKEVNNYEDRRIVSGIFWKRIDDGFPLQSCATLAYALGINKKQYSTQDTQINSPYNTYKNRGLPPSPICNPGLEAIKAAANPKESDYYYFLNNQETGQTVFSKTVEEHNLNKTRHGL